MNKNLLAVILFAGMVLITSSTAAAFPNMSCSYRDQTPGGEVDFGSGNHSFGNPAMPGTIRWSRTSINGVIVVTARVQGRLYLDKIGSGCARLKINFQNNDFNNIQETQVITFCGPGSNANSTQNRRAIDVVSLPNAALKRVQLTLGEGSTLGSIEDTHTGGAFAPLTNVTFSKRINNGNTDFGGNSHSGGGPSSDAFIELFLSNDGIVFGRVNGVLYWDALFGGGTARIITDFQNRNGTTLQSRTDTIVGPGGNANNIANKVLVLRLFNSAELFRIRVRVGKVSNGNFVNVVSRTYSFGCPDD